MFGLAPAHGGIGIDRQEQPQAGVPLNAMQSGYLSSPGKVVVQGLVGNAAAAAATAAGPRMQAVVLLDGHHCSGFHADGPGMGPGPLRGRGLDGLDGAASLIPASLNAIQGPLEIRHISAASSTLSPDTVSPGTVVGRSPDEPDVDIQVIPYNPAKVRKKSARGEREKTRPKRLDVLKTEAAPKMSVKKDGQGKVAGTMATFGLSQILRTPATRETMQTTAITRRFGACPRCHKNKLRCNMPENEYQPCGRCMELVFRLYYRGAQKHQYQPCIRTDLLGLRLHRKGPTIRDDLGIWVKGKQRLLGLQDSKDSRVLFLTQGIGEGMETFLSVTVSRFDPKRGDRTTYFWTDPDGNPREMEVPPYFISDLEEAKHNIRRFVHEVRSTYIDTLHGDSNPLIRQTFQAALMFSAFNGSRLVSVALDTWVAARLIETQWRVVAGGVAIGLEPKDEPGHPWNGFTPVTPIMDTQLDGLVIRDLLAPLSNRFLKLLKDKVDERRRENWLEIYLAMFIMMSNTGWTLKDMKANAAWKGLKAGSRGGTLTQGYMHACKSMLAYFHFACAGAFPLSLAFDKSSGGRDYHGMTADQVEYLDFVKGELANQEKLSKWRDLSMYDDDGYWCYQLLDRDWRGDIQHAGEVDDYREEDFLSSSTT
ncbi:hypothetical protein ACJ41O_014218 [Fusarium nematophilum]